MTVLASVSYLLITFYLLIQAPQLTFSKPQFSAQAQQNIQCQPAPPTTTVTTTQVISATDQAQVQPNVNEVYRRVAARSLGESSIALAEIACTIKNRLRVSKASLTIVLSAYYAQDRTPTGEHIEMVRKVFEGEMLCPESWWYALSPADTRRFRPHPHPAKVIKDNQHDQILIYDH